MIEENREIAVEWEGEKKTKDKEVREGVEVGDGTVSGEVEMPWD